MPKLLSHELYAIKLSTLNLGYALFEPDPNNAYDKVRVGDVGYISNHGKFIKLFNAFHKECDVENAGGMLPVSFEPIAERFRRIDSLGPLPPGSRRSESVRAIGGDLAISGPLLQVVGGASVRLSCKSRSGAALMTKSVATRQYALSSKAMEDYMIANCLSWLQAARTLGLPVEMHDIVLVNECTLTGDWATAVWDKASCESQVGFTAGVTGVADVSLSYWGQWEDHVVVPTGRGPFRPGNNTEEYSVTNFDQCVFLKGTRLAQREWYEKFTYKTKIRATDAGDIRPSSVSTEQFLKANRWKMDIVGTSKSSFRPVQYTYDIIAIFIFERSDVDFAIIDDNDLASFKFDQAESLEDIYDILLVHQDVLVSSFSNGDARASKSRICWNELEPSPTSTSNLILLNEEYKQAYPDSPVATDAMEGEGSEQLPGNNAISTVYSDCALPVNETMVRKGVIRDSEEAQRSIHESVDDKGKNHEGKLDEGKGKDKGRGGNKQFTERKVDDPLEAYLRELLKDRRHV